MGTTLRVVLERPPGKRGGKKWRVTFPDGRHVDFGSDGMSDFTLHKDPHRMANFLLRHGGISSREYDATRTQSAEQVLRAMRRVHTSTRESWHDPHTPGFWSRWLLWSEPTLTAAKDLIRRRFQIRVTQRRDTSRKR